VSRKATLRLYLDAEIKKGGILAVAILLVAAIFAAWFQLLNTLGSSAYGASDIGECARGIGKGLELRFSADVAKRPS
jgi:hypothetical protein